MNVTFDPYCPDGIVYLLPDADTWVANEAYWIEHFWEDIWGTGLRPVRWHLLPRF